MYDLTDLPGAGAKFANQTEETHGAGEALSADGAGVDQPGLVNGFHA